MAPSLGAIEMELNEKRVIFNSAGKSLETGAGETFRRRITAQHELKQYIYLK
jgi:hypothetical protein